MSIGFANRDHIEPVLKSPNDSTEDAIVSYGRRDPNANETYTVVFNTSPLH